MGMFRRIKDLCGKIDSIPLIVERLDSIGDLIEQREVSRQEEMDKLLLRQRKGEAIMQDVVDVLNAYATALSGEDVLKRRENELVKYILEYDSIIHQLERILRNTEGSMEWEGQLKTMREQLWKEMDSLEVCIVSRIGEPVDFHIHEVIQVQETANRDEDKLVYEVILPGISFRDKVLRKAKVVAYRYREEQVDG